MEKEIYKLVVCDYKSDMGGYWSVNAWTDPEKEDNGISAAKIDCVSGNIYYCCEDAKYSPKVRELAEKKQAEVRKEVAQRKGELGETIAMLTAQIWGEIYDKMREPDCTQLSCAIRDAAYKFEEKWESTPFEERDGYYIDMIDAFAEKTIAEFKDLYC